MYLDQDGRCWQQLFYKVDLGVQGFHVRGELAQYFEHKLLKERARCVMAQEQVVLATRGNAT
jgi:hypothetical protein